MNLQDLKENLRRNPKYQKAERELEKDIVFNIGRKVLEARLYKGMTQKELAERIGTQQPSIARIESGDYSPNVSFLQKIAEALGTELVTKFAFEAEYTSALVANTHETYQVWHVAANNKVWFPSTIIQTNPAFALHRNF